MVLSSILFHTHRPSIRRSWHVCELNRRCEEAWYRELKQDLTGQQWLLFCYLNISIIVTSNLDEPGIVDFLPGMLLNHVTGRAHRSLTISKELFLAICPVIESGWSTGSRENFLGRVVDRLHQEGILRDMIEKGELLKHKNARANLYTAQKDLLQFYVDVKSLTLKNKEAEFFDSLMAEQSKSRKSVTIYCELCLTLTRMLAKTLDNKTNAASLWSVIHAILLEIVTLNLNDDIREFMDFVIQICIQKQNLSRASSSESELSELYLWDSDNEKDTVVFI